MAYRSGTYIAFDGLGQTDPAKSDFRYYGNIQAWAAHRNIEFSYVNSHEKTYAVRDSSLRATLEARIRERLANSKNVVVILSSDTRRSGSMLSYEIEQAVDHYHLPLILAYVDYQMIAAPDRLSGYWPTALSERIHNSSAKAIHIPFAKDAILDAIGQFSISNLPATSLNYYNEDAHRSFGLFTTFSGFTNTRK